MRLIKYILIFAAILTTISVSGQDISVTADYPDVVRVGQQFNVIWTINTGDGQFSAPSFDGFYKLAGPQTSYSSSTQIINGKVSRETSYSYSFYLQAIKEGIFIIPPAILTIKNKTYKSEQLKIEVIGNGSSTHAQTPSGSSGNTKNEEVDQRGEDVFVNLSLDRKEVYLGEHILATVKIYTKVDISGINEIKYPAFDGFLKTDLNTPPLTSLRRENVNGSIYGTGVVQQFLLYPQVTGDINIDPVQISVLVQQKSGQSDPFFGDFFTTYTTVPRAALSKAVRVKVNPLPGVKPDDFSGIVGKVNISSSLNKDVVNVNDAVTLKFVVSGRGNLKLANAPEIKMPADVEVYDPKISDDLKNGADGTSGQKVFEYLMIPRHFGDYTIPPVTLSYFDITTKRYERLTTRELKFSAKKGSEQNTGVTVYGGVTKEDVKYLGKDIRFIKSSPGHLKKSGNLFSSKRSFYSMYVLALFLFLAVLFIRREHIRRNADISSVKNRKAAKIAGKRLKAASLCMQEGATDRFYEEILKAIWGYLSDKLNIPVSDLTREKAVNTLAEKGISEEEINNLNSILDKCEYVRFAPTSSGAEASRIFDDTSEFISTVENSIS